jgi:Putative beta-barrel porin-2, OmpL-like. bbp2
MVNYTAYRLSDKDRLTLRTDILADFQGQRLGFKTTYFEHTLGLAHYSYDWLMFRPEVRFDYTTGPKAMDNGTKRDMFTVSADMIIRF